MKALQLLLFVFLINSVYAQTIVRIDSMPEDGVLFEHDWRWKQGDNPAWANPAFNDSRWDTLPGSAAPYKVPQLAKRAITWFRVGFALDSAVARQSLSIRFLQMGASEIYLDGQLFRKLGRIGSAGEVIEAYNPTRSEYYLLPYLKPGPHWLAVRLAREPLHWYDPRRVSTVSAVLSCRILPTEGLAQRTAGRIFWRAVETYLLMGFFLALSAIHALYFWHRRQRINAVFSLTTLLFAINSGLGDFADRSSSPLAMEWYAFFRQLTQLVFLTLLLITYYLYLRKRPPLLFWIVTGVVIISCVLVFFTPYDDAGYLISLGLAIVLTLGIHVSIKAIRAKSVNARIVLTSLAVLATILTLELVITTFISQATLTQFPNLIKAFDLVFFVSIPLTLAVMLAREHDQTNRQLAYQLQEVEKLSAEKEQILLQQNATLERQVSERTAELRQSLEDLRTTQQQLVQREKMASLGELTAGIAHEIQNPLNFVNNFAEVSSELVQEIKEERERGEKRDEELEADLLDDLGQNLEKISQHGKRAASIVRGMLEHSRTSTGNREPTDLNALCDEYLRLSYHGLRAKDKSINAKLITDFDKSLQPVAVVDQDIGRVLLNLFNNAFYAVGERQKTGEANYEPTVRVSTRQLPDRVEIRVRDNGTGIPEAIREKIFQPFFTTKPTGQGTGLGLSLSYDIITKGHNGDMKVESEEGQGTTFTIGLPGK